MYSKLFWRDLCERVVSSAAGGALAALGAGAVNILQVDVQAVLGIAAGTALVSLLKGLAASKVGESGSPSLVNTTK